MLNIGKVQCQFPISIISTVSSIYLQYLSPISNWLISFIHSIKKHSLQCQVSTSTVIGYFPSQSHVRCASLVVSLGWHTLLHMLGFHKNYQRLQQDYRTSYLWSLLLLVLRWHLIVTIITSSVLQPIYLSTSPYDQRTVVSLSSDSLSPKTQGHMGGLTLSEVNPRLHKGNILFNISIRNHYQYMINLGI